MKRLFIITGEYSGDQHASYVVRELRSIMPDVVIEAIGGEALKKRGYKTLLRPLEDECCRT